MLEAKIEQLEPMRVAVYAVNSESPEGEALNGLMEWAGKRGLLNGDHRLFGYDSCKPAPNHVYTAWVTVGADVQGDDMVQVIDFPGGRYASTVVTGVEHIAPAWKELVAWVEDSQYRFGGEVSLEEMLDPLETPIDQCRVKLWLALAE